MKDKFKTKKQLIEELIELRQRLEQFDKHKERLLPAAFTHSKHLEKKLRLNQDELESIIRERTVELIENNLQFQRKIEKNKEIEKKLLEQVNFLQLLMDTIPQPVIYKDKAGLFQGCNTAYERYVGMTREDIIGKSVYEVYPEDLAKFYWEKDTQLINLSGIQAYETTFQIADGTRRDVFFNKAAYHDYDGNVAGLIGVMIDITEIKQAEEKLIAERERLFSLLNGLPAIVYLYDNNYAIRFSNNYFNESFGEPGERTCHEVLRGLSEPCDHCSGHHILENKQLYKWERTYPNGRSYQVYNYPFSDTDGTPLVLALGIDITDRKRIEEALWDSQMRYAALLKALPVGLVQMDPNGNCLYSNEEAKRITGLSERKLINFNWLRTVHPEDQEVTMMQWMHSVKNQEIFKMEFRYLRPEGDVSWVIGQAVPFMGHDKKMLGYIGTLSDITERKIWEKEIARLESLSLVGEMAAGIGHEIRNPLTTVRGFLQLLGEKHEFNQNQDYYQLMIDELDRANGIISEFLLLAKNKVITFKVQNLNNIINTMLPLIEADAANADKNIRINLEDLCDLPLNQSEIRQLMLNLVRNGLDAMDRGGTLTIRTYHEGKHIVLAVEDQGKGIDPHIIEKVGIPFCTTKDNGTGLGLAVCYSIAARHNAKIKFDTGPSGTTFFVRFNI